MFIPAFSRKSISVQVLQAFDGAQSLSIGALALATAMIVGVAGAQAHDEKKYPDFGGQWKRPPGIANQFDISKPQRLGLDEREDDAVRGPHERVCGVQKGDGAGQAPSATS